jgi:hypothetical protein
MNTTNTATELVARLHAATNNRERNKVLRDMARAFYIAIRNCDAETRDILGEKLRNYQFDISPYIPPR